MLIIFPLWLKRGNTRQLFRYFAEFFFGGFRPLLPFLPWLRYGAVNYTAMSKKYNLPTPDTIDPFRASLKSLIREAVAEALEGYRPEPAAPAAPSSPEWGSRHDAAGIAGISLPTLHGLISQGLVEARKVGRRTIVNLSDLREKIRTGEVSKYRNSKKMSYDK